MDTLKQRLLGLCLVVAFTPVILLFEVLDLISTEPKSDEEYVYAELD